VRMLVPTDIDGVVDEEGSEGGAGFGDSGIGDEDRFTASGGSARRRGRSMRMYSR